jgi:drug/metabolite transporter (DMT)-like permease
VSEPSDRVMPVATTPHASAPAHASEASATTAMVVATLLWGATFVVLRETLRRIPPLVLVTFRFAAAAALFALVLIVLRRRPGRTVLVAGLLSGILTACGYLFQAIGLTEVSAGTSAFLTTAGTLCAGLFAWPLLGQRPGALLAFGLAMAAAGTLLLAGRVELGWSSGEAWTLLGAFAYALQIVVVARFVGGVDAMTLAGVQALIVALSLAPFAAREAQSLGQLRAADLWRLAYLALAGSFVAPWLQIRAQRALSAGRTGLLFALEPVFALLFALLVGERFAPRWWWGAGLILCAVTLVEGRAAWSSASSRRASA